MATIIAAVHRGHDGHYSADNILTRTCWCKTFLQAHITVLHSNLMDKDSFFLSVSFEQVLYPVHGQAESGACPILGVEGTVGRIW